MKIAYLNNKKQEAEWEVIKAKSIHPLPAGTQWVDAEMLTKNDIDERIAEGSLPESTEASVLYDILSIYPAFHYGIFEVSAIPKDIIIEAIGYLKTDWGSIEWRHKNDVFLVNYPIYKQTCLDAGITPDSFTGYVQMCKHDEVVFAEIQPF